jgi:hypothetical protein
VTEADQDANLEWSEVFRRHRHDILNGLQLVQGYLQMGRPQQALTALSQLTGWLRTVSLVQMQAGVAERAFLFTVSTCPAIEAVSLDGLFPMTSDLCRQLCAVWRMLDQAVGESDVRRVRVRVRGDADGEHPCQTVSLELEAAPGVLEWWHGEGRAVLAGSQPCVLVRIGDERADGY